MDEPLGCSTECLFLAEDSTLIKIPVPGNRMKQLWSWKIFIIPKIMLHTDNPDHMTSDHITKDRVTEWSPYCTNTLSAPQVEGNILIIILWQVKVHHVASIVAIHKHLQLPSSRLHHHFVTDRPLPSDRWLVDYTADHSLIDISEFLCV